MKVKLSQLDPDLRVAGWIGKYLLKQRPWMIEGSKALFVRKSSGHENKTTRILTRPDGSEMKVRVWRSKGIGGEERVPVIVWMHGGGFVSGSTGLVKMMLPYKLMQTRKFVLVAPDYRLSKQAPYPAALEDGYQALLWVKEHAAELGVRDDQIFIGGESAGGGLTAALCLYARDKGEVNIAFQMPIYPMLDDRGGTQSMKDNNAPIWGEKQNIAAWKKYLGTLSGKDIPKYAAPARETDYHGLPPTATFIGEVDAFRDETIAYVEHLREAGIPVNFKLITGSFHSSEAFISWAKSSKEAAQFFAEAYDYACRNYFTPQYSSRL